MKSGKEDQQNKEIYFVVFKDRLFVKPEFLEEWFAQENHVCKEFGCLFFLRKR